MAKKDELIVTAESLGIATEGLNVAQLEEAIADSAKSKLVDEAVVEAKTKELATAFTHEGKTYGLSDLTPKTLKVLDDVYTQEELLQNKDAMEFLIVGNSCFIKRLK
ncbi:hypothetical protein BST83_13275 [Polaribacter filamentus]|uniref:Uncharacterized protein n=1 Tax=Polaribacter filamentus TaxID=53483 RepID=A0A2S7KZC7_9FLAO|nr:hypothetical protein [Polaribacter filamentus]PQB08015.1 hypothetical protein BST83_13275 [Polaribacter filamentus]